MKLLLDDPPFSTAKEILTTIQQFGYQAYFVGGCVRDLLLNREIGDVDIATSATPQEIMSIFDHVIPVGLEHGTVIVRYNDQSYEVTTFRKEGKYSDQRHPDHVTFIPSIEEDLRRRDFTINALAMNQTGEIIDLFNGKKDIENHLIRTVGDGKERFMEDPLRIIRALRFSSQIGFSIEEKTKQAMIEVKSQIENISVERILVEFQKMFTGDEIETAIKYFTSLKIYEYVPIFKDHPKLIEFFPKRWVPLHSFGAVITVLHYIYPKVTINQWIKAWKCSNDIKHVANHLSFALTYFTQNGLDEWLVYQLPPTLYKQFTTIVSILFPNESVTEKMMDEIFKRLPIHEKKDLAINGNDLLDLFPNFKKGKWIGNYIHTIEKKVIFGQLENNITEIKEWIRCHPPDIS